MNSHTNNRVLPLLGYPIRNDGIGLIDVRTTIESHDGALIGVSYTGLADLGTDGYQGFLKGDLPQRLDLRMVPRFQTLHPLYLWLNRIQPLGLGEVDFVRSCFSYDVYAVR